MQFNLVQLVFSDLKTITLKRIHILGNTLIQFSSLVIIFAP